MKNWVPDIQMAVVQVQQIPSSPWFSFPRSEAPPSKSTLEGIRGSFAQPTVSHCQGCGHLFPAPKARGLVHWWAGFKTGWGLVDRLMCKLRFAFEEVFQLTKRRSSSRHSKYCIGRISNLLNQYSIKVLNLFKTYSTPFQRFKTF